MAGGTGKVSISGSRRDRLGEVSGFGGMRNCSAANSRATACAVRSTPGHFDILLTHCFLLIFIFGTVAALSPWTVLSRHVGGERQCLSSQRIGRRFPSRFQSGCCCKQGNTQQASPCVINIWVCGKCAVGLRSPRRCSVLPRHCTCAVFPLAQR